MARQESRRLAFLDFLRAIASQLIVWHHMAFYGPVSTIAMDAAPVFITAMSRYGRLAVQVYLVVGGLVTARTFSRRPPDSLRAFALVAVRRYRRIGLPYLATLLLAIGANEWARHWMTHESISGRPSPASLLAHAFFLQDVLHFEALTAGVWYLAVDFQLVLLVALVLWLTGALARLAGRPGAAYPVSRAVFGALAAASLLYFNRHEAFDVYAIYFFGSFYLGMSLDGLLQGRVHRLEVMAWSLATGALGVFTDRPRLIGSAAVALLILGAAALKKLDDWPRSRVSDYLGQISYSTFLVHFPLCLVLNAAYTKFAAPDPWTALGTMVGAWLVSLCGAMLFHHQVEARLVGLGAKEPPAAKPAVPPALVRPEPG